MTDQPLLLIAEDEAAQAEVLIYHLKAAGFRCMLARDGAEALLLIKESPPDLLLLDWMLPEVSGIEICRQLKAKDQTRDLPVIMLTARGEEGERVRGLDTGADDYIVKPYAANELVARLRAVLRRRRPALAGKTLKFGDIELDPIAHKVTRGGLNIHLGPTEFRLLKVFMERPGRVLSRQLLIDLAWGTDALVEDRTVDVHIKRLRNALTAHGGSNIIRTVRGFGYALDDMDSLQS